MSVTSGKKKASVRKEINAVSATKPKIVARWVLRPRHAINRRERTRHGPAPACVQTPLGFGVTSCRGTVQSAWQKPPVRRKEEELGCPHALRRTGKAGENVQHSGEMGGSSPWTRPSAPECGHTLKAPAGDQRSIKGGDRPRRRLQDRYPLGHRPVVLLRTETARCTVRPT